TAGRGDGAGQNATLAAIVRRVRMPVSAQGRVVLRERFWAPEGLGGDRTVPPLLIRADAGASGGGRQMEIAEGHGRAASCASAVAMSRRSSALCFRASCG